MPTWRATNRVPEVPRDGSTSSRGAAPPLRYGPAGDLLPPRGARVVIGRKQASGPLSVPG